MGIQIRMKAILIHIQLLVKFSKLSHSVSEQPCQSKLGYFNKSILLTIELNSHMGGKSVWKRGIMSYYDY